MHALIIEDDALIAMMIEEVLSAGGFTSFEVAVSLNEAVAAARRRCPNLITADVELEPGSGIDAVQTICSETAIPVIFITGRADAARSRMPQHTVLSKPFRISEVEAAVREVMGEQVSFAGATSTKKIPRRSPGLWKIGPHGHASKFVELPKGAWPNGLDFGPDGMRYSPDSSLGQIWRIDPKNGRAEVAFRDRRLSARPFVALAPGANGLHFVEPDMIVTVSDSTEVLRYHLQEDGQFGGAELSARGIPGDDFAVGRDGSLLITTHPYNTLVRVRPDGRRTILADHRQQIIGATDAVFGRSSGDTDTLYVATNGGAFAGPRLL